MTQTRSFITVELDAKEGHWGIHPVRKKELVPQHMTRHAVFACSLYGHTSETTSKLFAKKLIRPQPPSGMFYAAADEDHATTVMLQG